MSLSRASATLLAALVLTGCASTAATPEATGTNPAPADSSAAIPTPASVSSLLGCDLPPGAGETQSDGIGVQYTCYGSVDQGEYAYFVLFETEGDKAVFARRSAQFATPGAPGGQVQVEGPLWVVWGNHQPTISAAVNAGGTLST